MSITEKLSFRASVIKYWNPASQRDWDPDFTYAVTYRATKKLTFSYSNYSAQFDGPEGDFIRGLTSGNLRLSYAFPKIQLPNDTSIACSGSIGLPNPTTHSTNIRCSYGVTSKLRLAATVYFHFPDQQGQYEPDYSYTASYRLTDDWSVSYSNYSNNRFPWNKGESPGPGFRGGSLALTYSYRF